MMQMQEKRNSSLDGVRAIAITLVVASHTGILGQGGLGNAIFFCLSGFLAAIPFKQDVEKDFLSIKTILNYYLNRLIRILPVYYVVIGTVYVATGRFFGNKITLLKNMLFIENFSHLWFLQQEMLMYFCLPFIFILIALIKKLVKFKYNDILCGTILVILTFLANEYLTADVFYLNGNGMYQKFRIGQFLIGTALGYLYKSYKMSTIDLSKNKAVNIICECMVFAFLLFTILSSEHIAKCYIDSYEGFYIGWQLPMFCTILAALFILALLLNPKGLLVQIIGSKPVSYIGRISFVIYLVHMFFVPFFKFGSDKRNFLSVYLVSLCIAVVLHVIVEKPSIILAKNKKIREVISYFQNLFASL